MDARLINVEQRQIRPSQSLGNTQYLIATVIMFGIGMFAVIGISISRPEQDNSIIITAVLGFTGTTLGSILAFMKSQETHASVNGRMDDFIRKFESQAAIAQEKSRLEGAVTGRSEGRAAADARTDLLAGQTLLTIPAAVAPATTPQVAKKLDEIAEHTKETTEVLKEIKDK